MSGSVVLLPSSYQDRNVKNKEGRSGFRDCCDEKTLKPKGNHHRSCAFDRSPKLSSKRTDPLPPVWIQSLTLDGVPKFTPNVGVHIKDTGCLSPCSAPVWIAVENVTREFGRDHGTVPLPFCAGGRSPR